MKTEIKTSLPAELTSICEPVVQLPADTNMGILVQSYAKLEIMYHNCKAKNVALVDFIKKTE